MFRKILIIAMFATAAGYCFAEDNVHQVVTSEVFYDEEYRRIDDNVYEDIVEETEVPAWPLVGSDADVEVTCDRGACSNVRTPVVAQTPVPRRADNIRIVSKIGDDMVVENNINMSGAGNQWSGGADMVHGMQIPAGFDNECYNGAEMPLLHREILEDDGGSVLAVSRGPYNRCGGYVNDYDTYVAKSKLSETEKLRWLAMDDATTESTKSVRGDIVVDVTTDADAAPELPDQVRSWVVANGQTLREVLQSWCDKDGWDLVWATSREYPIEASAVFKGRFVDVASALVRNFGRATPIPYAKFYKGNRVLVVSTTEE